MCLPSSNFPVQLQVVPTTNLCVQEVQTAPGISTTLVYVNASTNPYPVASSRLLNFILLAPSPFQPYSLPTSNMSPHESLADHLCDVDVTAQAAAFYCSPLDARRAASLSTDGRIRIPRKPRKDSSIIPSFYRSPSRPLSRSRTSHSKSLQSHALLS